MNAEAVKAKSGAGLWQADPHEFGPGKVHIVDAEDIEKTMCGRWLNAIPGRLSSSGRATCKTCLNGVESRKYRKAQEAQFREENERREAERRAKNQEWWSQYNAYLASPEWAERRRKVLRRAKGICEACLDREATQVHHLTYRYVFNEPCFDLRAVCGPCHDLMTDLDRERRG